MICVKYFILLSCQRCWELQKLLIMYCWNVLKHRCFWTFIVLRKSQGLWTFNGSIPSCLAWGWEKEWQASMSFLRQEKFPWLYEKQTRTKALWHVKQTWIQLPISFSLALLLLYSIPRWWEWRQLNWGPKPRESPRQKSVLSTPAA